MYLNDCEEWFVQYIAFNILILLLPYFKAALGRMCATYDQQESESGVAIIKGVLFLVKKINK